LKVDETKLPSNIKTFNCPQCRKPIPVSLVLDRDDMGNKDSETVLLSPLQKDSGMGKLHIVENIYTPSQIINLHEGVNIIGRKTSSSTLTTHIETIDKLMSRQHIIIEVKKDNKGQYKHYLSDNKSKNNTLYNNNYLEKEEVVVLKNKDEIQIGHTKLVFEE
jgi:pSer/pThr/pTyr-binding forkhead associated (FHA) protein